jgi:Kef-type K+ transport system membrane component KefB
MTSAQLSAVFFLQVFFILAVCRCVGILARRVGQPQVVGEMIAGVIMGPSLFGLLFPSWQQVIFPKDSLKILYVLAQFGVGLYMFLVGTEFKIDLFRSRARSAASVSVAGMVAPFILGGFLALWIRRVPGLFSEKATDFEAVLFLGAACPSRRFRCWLASFMSAA